MIKQKDLTESDIGKEVFYYDGKSGGKYGLIKSWNESFIFVVFNYNNDVENFKDYTGQACEGKFLIFR